MILITAIIGGILVFLMFVLFIEYTKKSRAAINQRMRYYADGTFTARDEH